MARIYLYFCLGFDRRTLALSQVSRDSHEYLLSLYTLVLTLYNGSRLRSTAHPNWMVGRSSSLIISLLLFCSSLITIMYYLLVVMNDEMSVVCNEQQYDVWTFSRGPLRRAAVLINGA